MEFFFKKTPNPANAILQKGVLFVGRANLGKIQFSSLPA